MKHQNAIVIWFYIKDLFFVNFNIGQSELVFIHIMQIFMDFFCKFSKFECHMLFSLFQVNLNNIT